MTSNTLLSHRSGGNLPFFPPPLRTIVILISRMLFSRGKFQLFQLCDPKQWSDGRQYHYG